MKSIKKKILSCLVAFMLTLSVLGLPTGMFKIKTATASTAVATDYDYYNQLNAGAKKFYAALKEMQTTEKLKSGNFNYNLIENAVISESDVYAYADGDKTILSNFAAAKDAFSLDHPEVFYVNFDLLSISVGTKNGEPYATMGTGRTNSYYAQGFSNKAQIDTAISALDEMASSVANLDLSVYDKVYAINSTVVNGTTYGFSKQDEPNAESHIRSIYGFLTYNLSVCEGFAKTFKFLCDKSNIPCKEVVGYMLNETTGNLEPHAWNVVKYTENGKWYAIDTTQNWALKEAGKNAEEFVFVGSEKLDKDHYENGKISENDFEFSYPTIAFCDLGKEEIKTVVKYNKTTDGKSQLVVEVSYQGKNVRDLAAEGTYIAIAYSSTADTISSKNPLFVPNNELEYFVKHYDDYSEYYLSAYDFVRFVATQKKPNGTSYPDMWQEYTYNFDEFLYYGHHETFSDIIENEKPMANTLPVQIESSTFETDGVTYQTHNVLPSEKTYNVTIVYSDNLEKINATQNVSVTLDVLDEDLNPYVEISNVEFDGEKTVKFKFTPSQHFKHDYESYSFKVNNLKSKTTPDSKINSLYASFRHKTVICSRILDGGRLYLDIYGSPTLVDNSDLSLNGWTYDDNGTTKGVVDSQRSQMALVVTKPNTSATTEMTEAVAESTNILASETYELNLNICSGLASIPQNSYVKLSFGFPEGYSYNSLDEGVTFKVYHFKKVNGVVDYENPEIMDVVITEYGLIVQTNNFSPFMVVATNASESDGKTIYARELNNFGTIRSNGNSILADKSNASIFDQSGNIMFDITPKTNYKVDYLLLNGEDITDRISNGKITLSKEELEQNNTLDIAFVHQEIMDYETQNNIVSFNKLFNQNQTVLIENQSQNPTNTTPEKANPVLVIIICIVAGAVVGAGVGLTVYFVKKKKSVK